MPSLTSLVIAGSEHLFYEKAARLILESANAAVQKSGRCSLVLCGGNTPQKVYSLLTEPYFRERVPWSNTFIFWGDERCVSPVHPESNYKMAHETLLSKVPIPPHNLFRIPAEMEPPWEGARAYEKTLKVFFKLTYEPPRFDLILLGLGEDGHTASLFPQTAAVKEKMRWVMANNVEKLSTYRITMTFPVINHAHRILFLCTGDSKAAILKEILREDFPLNRYPAQQVTPQDGELIWLLDPRAASKLPAQISNNAQRI